MSPSSAIDRNASARWLLYAAAAAMFAVLVAALHLMGRVPWYERGFGLWTASAWSRRTSQDLLDPYTFTHVLHGMLFYWALTPLAKKVSMPLRLLVALAVEVGWEILENTPWAIERYRAQTAALEYYGDSIVNAVGDTFACLAGFALAARLPVRATIALAIVEELALLVVIRDNLTLNVVMLLFPIEPLVTWQAGA